MTVAQLIEKLREFSPETDVTTINVGTGEYFDVTKVELDTPAREKYPVVVIGD